MTVVVRDHVGSHCSLEITVEALDELVAVETR